MYELSIVFKNKGKVLKGGADYQCYEEVKENFRALKDEFSLLTHDPEFEYGIINYSVDGITLKTEVFHAKGE